MFKVKQEELLIKEHPHQFRQIEGGRIVFFCMKGKAIFLALPDGDANRASFYELVGKDKMVLQIETTYFQECQPKGLCELSNWAGMLTHQKCLECKKGGYNVKATNN